MFTLRKKLTYANVTATLALVFAMSGGALAAQHYLISSTKQISPKVLKALKGNTGAPGQTGLQGLAGAPGAAGKEGTPGKEGSPGKEGPQGKEGTPGKTGKNGEPGEPGKEGSPWTAGGTLPQGSTEKGEWSIVASVGAAGSYADSAVSFTIPLKIAPAPIYIGLEEGEGEPKESPEIKSGACKGTVVNPGAGEGDLCIFVGSPVSNAIPIHENNNPAFDMSGAGGGAAGTTGVALVFFSEGAGLMFGGGTWAVTAGP
ncbi:MAG: hypothetical protein WA484_02265 [Solirubrobacteraceae bacterium]